ncbi:MAG TPA: hypothetical protein DEH25_03875 [Chloroflexi bacterium]|nr:hypothetical protein [Chloroflexota bacterium]HBY06325.1 hypothetical protein [Chloroflexota bacterium]
MRDTKKMQDNQLVANIPVGVYQFRTTPDEKMSFDYVNQMFCDLLKLPAEVLYEDASAAFNVIHPDDYPKFVELNNISMRTRVPFSWEGRFIIAGEVKWMRIASTPEMVEDGDVLWSGFQIDITERKRVESALREANTLLANRLAEIEKLQAQLQEHAIRDYLTGLYNRRYLDETIERELALTDRDTRMLSVVMMDIDQFKGVNDVYGHQMGDKVLIELAWMLQKNSRSSDIACRYGGDEFVVVMLNAAVDHAYKRAEEWREIFAKKIFQINNQSFSTTLSLGIATYPIHSTSPMGIFLAADEALYHSKKYNNMATISRRLSTGQLRSLD